MSGHTPGPWVTHEDDWGVHVFAVNNPHGQSFGFLIAESISGDYTQEAAGGSPEANARLIAAAPELLEALRRYVEFFGNYYVNTDAEFQAMRAEALDAIAKATGEAK